jgi:nitroreductase/NAD-dependent dihydropyrimidine dehydrogenase PreA subunit
MVNGLKVDEAKCTGCGICADVCLTSEISRNSGQTPKAFRPEEECILCGHCVAACPTAALSVGSITPSVCRVFDQKGMPTISQTDLLLTSRRSTRNFLDKPVTRDTIQEIIDVARYAPSGINAQPIRWLAVTDKKTVRKYAEYTMDWVKSIVKDPDWLKRGPILPMYVSDWEAGRDTITFSAPSLVMSYAEPRWEEECKMAMTFLDLTAHSRGLGTCWMGLMNMAASLWEPFRSELALPEGTKSFGIMTLGYPKYTYHRIPARREARIQWR